MAIVSVRVETKEQRLARERTEWITKAMGRLFELKVYDPNDPNDAHNAFELADNLHFHSLEDDGTNTYDPADTVDEELTYWD